VGRVPLPLLALLGALALAALAATGCGSDRSNLIPSSRAQALVSELSALQTQIAAGEDCDNLGTRLTTFHNDATSLPNSVDKRLHTRINQGVKSLQTHAASTCQDAADAAAAKAQEEQTQTETQTTDTTTTQTETTPTTTTDTTPTTPTTTGTTPSTTTPPSTSDTSPGGTGAPSDTNPGDTGGTGDGSDDGGTG
jgi:hypothetical protein